MSSALPGRLWLVPNTLDLGLAPVDLHAVLPAGVLQRAAQLHHWVAENAKTTRAFLKRIGAEMPLAVPLQDIDIRELPRTVKGGGAAAQPEPWRDLLAPALRGADLGLISEAGLPAVADPGAALVAAAHALRVPVMPMSGPSSLMLALAASGLNGQSFAFVGYLPQDDALRARRLRELEQRSRSEHQTQLAIETPYRNEALMRALLQHLQPGTKLAVACGLTLPDGWCRTLRVADWRDDPPSLARQTPAVFAWLA